MAGRGGVDAVAVDQHLVAVLGEATRLGGGLNLEVAAQPGVGDGVEDRRKGQAVEIDDGRDGFERLAPAGHHGFLAVGGDESEEIDIGISVRSASAKAAGEEQGADALVVGEAGGDLGDIVLLIEGGHS